MCCNRGYLHIKSEIHRTSLQYFTIELLPYKKLGYVPSRSILRKGLPSTENIECWLRNLIQLLKTTLMKGKSDEPCCGFGLR
jgi:hypothetical protein